jgi:hypothetical protein
MRRRRSIGAWIGGCAACLGALAVAGPSLAQQTRCLEDAMGRTFCARSEEGVALRSGLGEIVCSRGRCVQEEHGTQWHCSRREGGWARLGPAGPECEEGCTSPTQGECEPQ